MLKKKIQQASNFDKMALGTDHLTCRGGLWFFVLFRIFFSDNTRVRIFFPEFNIRLYDKNYE
jgi:hypothetical protein